MEKYAFSSSEHLSSHEVLVGDVLWVKVRARGAENIWITPQEAVDLGRDWVKRYGAPGDGDGQPNVS